ncbi:ABC transporter permease [Lysinibacillus contaminans]|uniref:ABC transporter permease n=1 Tax=Lysinibacillus contaminans TaxID=1293441 RepID=A0ABR5K2Y5_9BACI|nr:hypothetical protein [Lysinibacillus contaminans]KOS69231.1 ABC transporter permease [Lysinibacillus contaminans]
MSGLLRYQFINYLRTYRYVPPFSIFIIFLVVNYTFTPNPILDSYSFSSIVLFFIMGWFTITIFHSEDEDQKIITLLHIKNRKEYNLVLFMFCVLTGLCLSCLSVTYPILIDAFGLKPKPLHIMMGFLSHFSLSFLAIALSAIFTRDIVKNKQNTWWGVLSTLIISLAITTLKSVILQIKGLIWLLPPVYLSLEMMDSGDENLSMPGLFYWQFTWIFMYSILVIGIFFLFTKRK